MAHEYEIAASITAMTNELTAPHVLLKPKVFIEDGRWCCVYGESIQNSVRGYGKTPHEAALDFDFAWYNQKAELTIG